MDNDRTVIMVLDRGFVIVAKIEPHPDRPFWWITTAERTIRTWGTTKGLAELCNGPTSSTVLDPICTGEIPWRAVIKILDAEASAWSASLTHSPAQRKRKSAVVPS